MADELTHGTVGTELTQAEWEAVGAHVFNSQAAGDILYASTTAQLSRLGVGSNTNVLTLASGLPSWAAPVAAAAGSLTGSTLASGVTASSLTSVGTIATGVWQGTDVGVAYGGTGVSTLTANGVLVGNGASAIGSIDMSTKGHVLIGDGSGNPQMLGVGTNTHVMTADSGETTGVKWAAPAAAAAGSLTGSTLASGVVTTSATTVGVLNAGSITSGFSTIDVGSSSIAAGSFDASDGDITNVGTISLDRIDGDGTSIGINTAANAARLVYIGGTFTTTGSAYGMDVGSILVPAADSNAQMLSIGGTLTGNGSSTHARFAALSIGIPNISIGSATVTEATSLYIDGPPSQGSAKYAIHVNNGTSRFDGEIEMDADLNHDGSNIGFFGVAPAARAAAYTPSNVSIDRAYDANSSSVAELADVLGTLIADLQTYGLLQ